MSSLPHFHDYELELLKRWAGDDITQSFINYMDEKILKETHDLRGVQTHEQFKYHVGRIDALDDIRNIIKEAGRT